ncbi:hypothetical protein ACOACO_03535 [Nocardioides sp. CPCC 205120]|uniref:hypothetical protein n=1 Tax=Nocardioides sp. CPCC 205120 TaxID=3406462 RepID=UPI003B5032C2
MSDEQSYWTRNTRALRWYPLVGYVAFVVGTTFPVGVWWTYSYGLDRDLARATAFVLVLGLVFGLTRSVELQWASRGSAVRLEEHVLVLTGGSHEHRVDVDSVVRITVEQGYSWWDLVCALGAESLPRVLVIADDGRICRSGALGYWGDPEREAIRLRHDVRERRGDTRG